MRLPYFFVRKGQFLFRLSAQMSYSIILRLGIQHPSKGFGGQEALDVLK